MKRLTLVLLVLIATIAMAGPTDPPKLSDADRLTLITLQRDFEAAKVKLANTAEQCRTATDTATKAALAKRDALQAVVDKLAPQGPTTYVLDLDKAAYVERKEAPKAAK